ncbi:uncharacterized protein [Typha latifolia]|uniref:uncharacterized protein n=1 Tax=Typha latifolia TaxID=4733 RepID=UPI003C30A2A1
MVVERESRLPLVIHRLFALLLMALISLLPTTTSNHHHRRRRKKPQPPVLPSPSNPRSISNSTHHSPSSWEQLKSLLSCRSAASAQVHDPTAARIGRAAACGGSICSSLGDVAVHRRHFQDATSASSAASDCGSVSNHEMTPLAGRLAHRRRHPPPPPPKVGMQLRGLSGCYECRAVNVELMHRYPRPRTLCACSDCGEVFTKQESLEHHQAIRHAVSELGPEDSGRNIVEIIFKSSWQKKDHPICQIERILKVHNSPRTIARFEAYRDAVKARYSNPNPPITTKQLPQNPNSKNARAAADGNELLRFHSASLSCRLGFAGSTSLCSSSSSSSAAGDGAAACGVCAAIRHGVGRAHHHPHPLGVRTTASSGRSHDHAGADPGAGGSRAMLVCRVIAGRVRRSEGAGDAAAVPEEPYDSVAVDGGGVYGNLEELFVANPRAILPCFVVIYRAMD